MKDENPTLSVITLNVKAKAELGKRDTLNSKTQICGRKKNGKRHTMQRVTKRKPGW